MKTATVILVAISMVVIYTSCVKTVDVIHNIHDTTILNHLQIDTFTRTSVKYDTTVIHDNNLDTVIQVKHDTIVVKTTTTDTLFKVFSDTLYLTKTVYDTTVKTATIIKHDTVINYMTVTKYDTVTNYVTVLKHDTVTKTQYLHDTLNNFTTVIQSDTIIKINTVIKTDTLYQYGFISNYKVPATDSMTIYLEYDTLPLTFKWDSIVIQNIETYVPPLIPFESGPTYTQQNTYYPSNDPKAQG